MVHVTSEVAFEVVDSFQGQELDLLPALEHLNVHMMHVR